MSQPSRVLATLAVALSGCLVIGSVHAQQLPRSFVASPDIYKVLAQNEQFKVISVTWKPGQKDVLHSHPAGGVYYLTDCSLRFYPQDGSTHDEQPKAGAAIILVPIPGHIVENIGPNDCRLIMFEPS
jgi:quercetin dioxygenase-like cupin family protein